MSSFCGGATALGPAQRIGPKTSRPSHRPHCGQSTVPPSIAPKPHQQNMAPGAPQNAAARAKRRLSHESLQPQQSAWKKPAAKHPTASSSQTPEPELHPLLRDKVAMPKAAHPFRQNVRQMFDAAALNPYIDQSTVSATTHRPRPLQLNPKGKYVAQGEKYREQLKQEQAEQEQMRADEAKGILPDVNTQEELFAPVVPPPIEWWDRPYLGTRSYGEFERAKSDDKQGASQFILDSDEAPVSIYIQHPVPVEPPWERFDSGDPHKIYLTKREMKRKRRNERQIRHQEAQDRIRLGLDPPPPPKVKLANLMNVLTNEAIKDPTGVEMRVRQQVQERYDKHMRENEQRRLTAEQRREKSSLSHDKQLAKGLHTTVYRVEDLSDGQHFFKVDMNAKQLHLYGIVMKNPRFNLVVVEGSAKSTKFFKKLMTRRINWQQSSSGTDLSANKCTVVWEGEIAELSFRKWSPMYTQDDDEAYRVLNKFGHENYWREAYALK